MVAKMINLALRAFEFLWVLLIMSLVGNMIQEADAGNPPIINFTMFSAVFGMLSLFYLIPATAVESLQFAPIIMIVLDALNTLIYFCCAVALAAYLGVHSCGNPSYVDNNFVTNGTNPGNRPKRCHEAQASDAFLWFGFAGFAASTVFSALQSRGSANLAPKRGGTTASRV